ncbi:MAG: SLC13/DASS family transporter [Candidatus Hydrogenedentes bacterium]|nr:SLC13/DASS family transporter [Candidatus Hydrogenedentota bacterium]
MPTGVSSDHASKYQRTFMLAGILLALLVLFLTDLDPQRPQVTYTAAIAVLMAFWWITGALPLAVTALVPLVLFPAFGILDSADVAALYINDTIFLFIGGFLVALAMERWDLHRRIALRLLKIFGRRPRGILFGFMAPTFFLSMWISNTATAMMMVPIATSVILRLEEHNDAAAHERFATGLLLSIAYSASIGGTATLVGTPPNLAFARIFADTFPAAPEISFATWFLFGFPLALVLLVSLWLLLAFFYCPRGSSLGLPPNLIRQQFEALGPRTGAQNVVGIAFVALALLWLTRVGLDIGSLHLPGWADLFPVPAFVGDGTVAIGVALLLFCIPAPGPRGRHILDWPTARDLPWEIVLLFGGGFALAGGFKTSGLSAYVGQQLQVLSVLPPLLLVFAIALIMSFLTELTSNTATTQLMLPVLAALAVAIGVDPILLMVPATLACSYAFMLPVATPPNAIILGAGRVSVAQMARTGLVLNMIAVVLVTVATFTLGAWMLGIDLAGAPAWAR